MVIDGENLVAAIPYQVEKKFGLRKIEQNAFSNELGIFHLPGFEQCVGPLANRLFRNRFVSIYRFNTHNELTPGENLSFELTHHLSLNKSIGEIREKYTVNLKRNLKKAAAQQITIKSSNDIEPLISMFKTNVAFKIYGIEEHQYDTLRVLFREMKNRGVAELYNTYSPDNEILSSAIVLKSGESLVYYFAASSEEGRKQNSQAFLIDWLLENNSNQEKIFDFEGGNTDGLARFYSSFGATPVNIPKYRKMYGEALLKRFRKGV